MRSIFLKIRTCVFILMWSFALSSWGQHDEATQDNLKVQNGWPKPVEDTHHYGLFVADILEYRGKAETVNWDFNSWRGSDANRLWIKSEGEKQTNGSSEEDGSADIQILYGRLISPYWDLQLGLRFEQLWSDQDDPSRYAFVLGLQGLSLYMFEIDASLFLNQEGGASGRLTASEDFLLTQKWIIQPRIEAEAAASRSSKFQQSAGLNELEFGIRLRYEIIREFAPYAGVSWAQLYNDKSDFARASGEKTSETNWVLGLRAWF